MQRSLKLLEDLGLEKTGDRLRRLDSFIIDILKIRLASGGLSDNVAAAKMKESQDGIFSKRRQIVEDERIAKMKVWATRKGIDYNFAASLMYQIIAESCRVQDELMIKEHSLQKGEKGEESEEEYKYRLKREELLALTALVAPTYSEDYEKGFLGTKQYLSLERIIARELIKSIDNKDLAIDLGCATGVVSFEISKYFEKVIGYDICPHMIAEAQKKAKIDFPNTEFVQTDIESDFVDLKESASLVVMNLGTASDIKNIDKVIDWIYKSLKPGGKFFLSFYNSESLLSKLGFIPWPMPLAAAIDQEKNLLEVFIDGDVFFLYARPYSISEVEFLLSAFNIESIHTAPTIASILPDAILKSEDKEGKETKNSNVEETIREIDDILAHETSANYGTYIIVTGNKPL